MDAATEEQYMPSPFPGMNPYLEQADVWQDFHQSFIPLELPEDQRWLIGRGDVPVSRSDADSTGTAVVLLEAPAIGRVPLSVDIEHHAFLEIRDRGNRQPLQGTDAEWAQRLLAARGV
jgi:hypothetical protein